MSTFFSWHFASTLESIFCLDKCLLQLITVNSNQICLSLFLCVYILACVCVCVQTGAIKKTVNSKPASTAAVHHRPSECRSLSFSYSLLCSLSVPLHLLTSNSHFSKHLPPSFNAITPLPLCFSFCSCMCTSLRLVLHLMPQSFFNSPLLQHLLSHTICLHSPLYNSPPPFLSLSLSLANIRGHEWLPWKLHPPVKQ